MKIPLLDLQAQYASIRSEIREALDRVCDSQHFILGPEVAALEEEIAAFCGAKYAVGVSSGTDALLAALMAIRVGPGDEVITTTYSFFATAGVISRLGARPIFVDINPATFNIESADVARKITTHTRAILPVHLFGRCAEMDSILETAKEHGIYVIEDAAQAIGAKDQSGRSAGTMGHMGCFSFFPSKNLGAFGDGGMVITDCEDFAKSLRILRVHGGNPKYHHKVIGGNFRLDALQAAVVRVKLKHLPAWTAARRRNADRYRRMFAQAGLLDYCLMPADELGHIYNQFVVRFRDRDRLQSFLKEKNIETEIYYPVPLHLQDCFRELEHFDRQFPEAVAASSNSLALPVYPELTEEQQLYVVNQINFFYTNVSPGSFSSAAVQ